MDLLSLKEHHARTLLIYYRWDVDKVFNVFAERGKEWLYSAAGLSVRSSKDRNSSESLNEVTCQICFEDVHTNEFTIMDCGHCFCNNCESLACWFSLILFLFFAWCQDPAYAYCLNEGWKPVRSFSSLVTVCWTWNTSAGVLYLICRLLGAEILNILNCAFVLKS